ncbi:MAG TPA: RNA polymerase sigma-70 factor [Pedobacter sp.]|nr:RNA polymerase sigma-70 factor [Pedobacter sp.]
MTATPLHTEPELLAKVAMGDERAFRTIYEKYHRRIYTYALQILHSDVQAEEVTQEIFLKLWTQSATLHTIDNLEGWLKTMTRNRCLNLFRRIVLEAKHDHDLSKNYKESHNETEESILLNDTRNLLNAAIELLPAQQKEVYQLCHVEGLKYEEAAERLNISPNTVKTHMKRALASVREHIRNNTDIAAIVAVYSLMGRFL